MTMTHWMLACGCAVLVVGCAARSTPPASPLVFLTRDGCVNTDHMRANLDTALQSLGRPTQYQVIDADTLPASDPRGGYGTPTVLVGKGDLFGMPEPSVPHPPAT
ncbi:MAG TPA: hypothetical protein VEK56_07675 [Vicinamibacterales bacterium]|nr:hypothetical protein [Vicinamibacterales bacterium]